MTACSVCTHPLREAIDNSLIAGATPAELARVYAIHRGVFSSHRLYHLRLDPLPPSICLVCARDDRDEIDAQLFAGYPCSLVAKRFGLRQGTVGRHLRKHLGISRGRENLGLARCKVCIHPDKDVIDEAMRAGILTRIIVARHHLTRSSALHHKRYHLGIVTSNQPNQCGVCRHLDHRSIDRDLINGIPTAHVSKKYHIDKSTIGRHKRNHLKRELRERHESIANQALIEVLPGRGRTPLRRALVGRGTIEEPASKTMTETALIIAERDHREKIRIVALAGDALEKAKEEERKAWAVIQQIENASTELLRRKVAREITDRQHSA